MSATDPSHPDASPAPDDGRCRDLRDALVVVAALDHSSVARAADALESLAARTGHAPLCVARQVLHLLHPTRHPRGAPHLADAVHRRWAPALRRHRYPEVTERVWATVLAHAAPTRPPALRRPTIPIGTRSLLLGRGEGR